MNSCKNRTFIAYVLPTKLWRNKTFYGSMSIFVCMGMLKFLWVIMIFYCFILFFIHCYINVLEWIRHIDAIFFGYWKNEENLVTLGKCKHFCPCMSTSIYFSCSELNKKVGKIFFPINIRGIFYRVQIIMHWPISI